MSDDRVKVGEKEGYSDHSPGAQLDSNVVEPGAVSQAAARGAVAEMPQSDVFEVDALDDQLRQMRQRAKDNRKDKGPVSRDEPRPIPPAIAVGGILALILVGVVGALAIQKRLAVKADADNAAAAAATVLAPADAGSIAVEAVEAPEPLAKSVPGEAVNPRDVLEALPVP